MLSHAAGREEGSALESDILIMKEKGRLAAIAGYLTLVGWLAGWVIHRRNRTPLAGFHLRQSLLLHLTAILIYLLQVGALYVPHLGKPAGLLLILAGLIWLFFWAAGLIFAFSAQMQPLPFFGKIAHRIFNGLK
jgi:uncharacterized membrane protein